MLLCEIFCAQKKPREDKVLISSTFYGQLLRTKVFREAFLYLHIHCRFVLFWCTEIGAKAAHKMLVKLTEGLLPLILDPICFVFTLPTIFFLLLVNFRTPYSTGVDPTKLYFFGNEEFAGFP